MRFGRNTKAENTAAISLQRPEQPPRQQIINNHEPSRAASIIAVYFCGLFTLMISWPVVIYILKEMGFRKPYEAVGWGVVSVAFLYFAAKFVEQVVLSAIQMYWDFRLQLEEIRRKSAETAALVASRPMAGASRLTEEQSQFAALLYLTMQEAYQYLAKEGEYKGSSRPWSRRHNKGREIPGFSDPITEDMAGRVRVWLDERGVVRRDQINTEKFPTFAHFEALLEKEFYLPVQVNTNHSSGHSPTLIGRYEPID